jgi:hypothetical protein
LTLNSALNKLDFVFVFFILNPPQFLLADLYTVAGKAIGFAFEQPLHVVALAYSAL